MSKWRLTPFSFVPQQTIVPYPFETFPDETHFTLRWDYDGWRQHNNYFLYTQRDWNQTILTKINQLRAEIHRQRFSQDQDPPINRVTCSPEIEVIMWSLEYFHIPQSSEFVLDVRIIGNLVSRFTVYRDINVPPNRIYVGTDDSPHLGCVIIDNL